MAAAAETMLLTIFLRHDQSNNLDAIQARLKAANWWSAFPPEGVEIVSWTVAMGFGQIVILRLPASKLALTISSTLVWILILSVAYLIRSSVVRYCT